MGENFEHENHLQPPHHLPLSMLLCHQKTLMNYQSFQTCVGGWWGLAAFWHSEIDLVCFSTKEKLLRNVSGSCVCHNSVNCDRPSECIALRRTV